MRCAGCEMDFFGGGICPRCGVALKRGDILYGRVGEPLASPAQPRPGENVFSGPRAREATAQEPGEGEGALVRWSYKILESVFACALFSVVLRVVIFFVKVIDSLMETGGDIKEGISFLSEIQRAISWYEEAVWVLIAIIVLKYRHGPK